MIKDIIISEQKIIGTDGGPVYHGIKDSDSGFCGFGEVYFSFVKKNIINECLYISYF